MSKSRKMTILYLEIITLTHTMSMHAHARFYAQDLLSSFTMLVMNGIVALILNSTCFY